MTDTDLDQLHESMRPKFVDIGAGYVLDMLEEGQNDMVDTVLENFDGNTDQLQDLVKQYRAARRAEESGDKTNWNHVIAKMEDSNTSKNEVRRAIADLLIENHDWMAPRETENLWHFKNPAYSQDGSITIKEFLWNNLNGHISRRDVSEVTEQIMSRCTIERDKKKPPTQYIALKNGWYDIKKKEMVDPKPEYFMTNSVPVEYIEDADCPQFKDFVHDIVPTEEDVQIIQEMFGYCLYRGYPLDKAFMLLGSGSNGKSTLLKILTELIGKENVANEDLQDITDSRWGAAKLYRKLANISDDLDAQRLQSSGTFKKMVGGSRVSAEDKGQDKFEFTNYAKLIFAANELPATPDTNHAFFRRWIIIEFPNEYTEDPDDGMPDIIPDLHEKIIEAGELPGILQWALNGLHRVLKRQQFTASPSSEQTKNKWLLRAQPMQVFFENALELSAGVQTPKDEVYQHYAEFCELLAVPQKQRGEFFKNLYSEFPQVERTEPRIGDSRQKMLVGLTTIELKQVAQLVVGFSESNAGVHAHAPALDTESPPSTRAKPDISAIVTQIEQLGSGDSVAVTELLDSFDCEDELVEDAIDAAKDEGSIYEVKSGRVAVL